MREALSGSAVEPVYGSPADCAIGGETVRVTITKLGSFVQRYRLVCLAFVVLSVGCNTVVPPRHVQSEGRDIDPNRVKEIVPGTTTKREIVDQFGKPDQVNKTSDGSEEYVFAYSGVIEKNTELILWARKEIKDERKRLRVEFAGDAVRSFAYTNSALPEENLSKQAGSSEVSVTTLEGLVDFTNEFHQVRLDVAQGLSAKVVQTASGALDVGIPAANSSALRMRVRSRFGSVNPGTNFTTSVSGEVTDVAVSQGSLVVRSRTGCDLVDAGSHKEVQPPQGEAAAALSEIRFPAVHFEFRIETPRSADGPLVDCVADLLKDYPDVHVRIAGHSDDVGSNEHNLRLSKARANAVRRALVAGGIEAARLDANGYGKSRPISSNRTEEGRAQNRRVDFTVTGKP